ncbi:MAG: dihydrodipicolinate synthase family protein [Anaerolineae bacterium]|nr:dihydrodipicolinate synthase family protein [Candidatus Roseilinea sp.]MDW8449470.1 dihydrodipicolinate synthase family protein [Anaerolineae bacterium]
MDDRTLWRGVFAIPLTPWTDDDEIDEDVLRAEIEFIIAAGARGVIGPILVSEFQALSEAERRTFMRILVEQTNHRLPVIVNVAGVNTAQAVGYARYAREIGADGVIAMPPYALRYDLARTRDYLRQVAAAAQMPVMIQNADIAPLSPDQVVALCSEIAHVRWVKEEVSPRHRSIGALAAMRSPYVHGIMGGGGGQYIITEHARGACGTIIAPEICDVVQRIWDLLDAGALNEAATWYERALPAINLEFAMGMAFAKYVMVKRGVFKNYRMRAQADPLDADDIREIERVYARLEPHLIWRRAADAHRNAESQGDRNG